MKSCSRVGIRHGLAALLTAGVCLPDTLALPSAKALSPNAANSGRQQLHTLRMGISSIHCAEAQAHERGVF